MSLCETDLELFDHIVAELDKACLRPKRHCEANDLIWAKKDARSDLAG